MSSRRAQLRPKGLLLILTGLVVLLAVVLILLTQPSASTLAWALVAVVVAAAGSVSLNLGAGAIRRLIDRRIDRRRTQKLGLGMDLEHDGRREEERPQQERKERASEQVQLRLSEELVSLELARLKRLEQLGQLEQLEQELEQLKRVGLVREEGQGLDPQKRALTVARSPSGSEWLEQLERMQLSDDVSGLIETLASNAHAIWAMRRLQEGWVPGPERDANVKADPSLVHFEELPEIEKQYDREIVRETLRALVALGYEITSVGGDPQSKQERLEQRGHPERE